LRSAQEDIMLLDAYIKGSLDADATSAIESRLVHDTNLKEDLEELRVLEQGIRVQALADKLEMMRGWEEEMVENKGSNGGESKSASIISIKKWMAAASIIFLLGAGWWWIAKESMHQQYAWKDEEFYKYILHQTERSNEIDKDQQKTLAYNLFTAKHFSEAKPKLESLWVNQRDTLAYFYLGITEVSLGNKEKAKAIFNAGELVNYPTAELLKLCE
jgi:hypothetical protein